MNPARLITDALFKRISSNDEAFAYIIFAVSVLSVLFLYCVAERIVSGLILLIPIGIFLKIGKYLHNK